MKRRLDDHLEELPEDYFDDDLDEWIDESAWDLVAEFYEYDTEQMVRDLILEEVDRSLEDGDVISYKEAELRIYDEIEEMEEDRSQSAEATIEAERADEVMMARTRAIAVDCDTTDFKRALVDVERQRARRIIESDEGEELREAATSLADERFFGS